MAFNRVNKFVNKHLIFKRNKKCLRIFTYEAQKRRLDYWKLKKKNLILSYENDHSHDDNKQKSKEILINLLELVFQSPLA